MGTDRRTIRLGLLGCADVAVRRVLPAVTRLPGMELAVSASRTLDKAEKVAADFGGEAVEGYERLLENPHVDAVYIPLPSGMHAHWTERALAAGKHVLAEKPLTTGAGDTESLHALAVERGLVLRENFMFLGHRLHDRVAALLESQSLGRIHSFHAAFTIPARPARDIRHCPELGGGALLDTAGYPVRAAIRFFGTDMEVSGAVLRHDPALGVDLSGSALLRTSDGVAIHCTFGLDHHYTSTYQFLGSAGRLSVDHVFTTPADHRPIIRIDDAAGRSEEHVPADDQFVNSLSFFADDIRRSNPGTDSATRVQAKVIDRIRELSR
ncbi:Gfo/Idh/MocA family oxidoreductase [Lipingzhangella sp. LS1_29]|uniref:Gfo/Idh/MocA family oxidoreductase n=1 Tax=Lipingzhangella rawalii TaxID=2055835 RepID=A0ABU2H741_9ACTN|nr:Gfo/Idh/MocA family oxidoreductase [Lipingzhangella rawalii]MDS1270797.1 Gfo/Idh/MocA family oxidoreductase [Lipingzhangella rawalii]